MTNNNAYPSFQTPMEWALYLAEIGFTVMPTFPGTKKPVEPWGVWEADQSPEHIRAHWTMNPDHEPALITGDSIIVFDADSPEAKNALHALEMTHQMVPSVVVNTRKGQHRYYRRPEGVTCRQSSHSTDVHPDRIDVKTGRSALMAPGSKDKVVDQWEIAHLKDLNPVTQAFVDDVAKHNRGGIELVCPLESTEKQPLFGIKRLPQLRALIAAISPEDYQDWIAVGMALYRETEGHDEGLSLFDEWSAPASTYGGSAQTASTWASFGKPVQNPRTAGTLIHMARQAGANVDEILGGVEEFEPCTYEVVSPPDSKPQKDEKKNSKPSAGHQLAKFSLIDQLENIEQNMVDEKLIFDGLFAIGQASVVYAVPNAGKTLLCMHLLTEDIRKGNIDPSKVFYLNLDDNAQGMLEKLRLSVEYGFHMLVSGYQGFEASKLFPVISKIIEEDTANGTIILLDTMTKVADLMSKSEGREFTALIRKFTLKGGTLIGLAHRNKNPGASGKSMYAGTTDLVDNLDCAFYLDVISPVDEPNTKVVQFENFKNRGSVKRSAAYRYTTAESISYEELLMSVEEIDSSELGKHKKAMSRKSDEVVIEAIRAVIGDGVNTKMKLLGDAKSRAMVSVRDVMRVLENYTGEELGKHCWRMRVGARGAKIYEALPVVGTPPVPAPTHPGSSPGSQVSSPAPTPAAPVPVVEKDWDLVTL